MKILLAVHHFPPNFTAGAELQALRTARQLQAQGHGVRVLCVEDPFCPSAQRAQYIDDAFEGIQVRRLFYNLKAAPAQWSWEHDNPWIGEQLESLINEYRPDVLNIIGGYLLTGRCMCVASSLGLPAVLTLTDYWFLCPRIQMVRSDGTLCERMPEAHVCAQCLGETRRRYRIGGRLFPGLMRLYWNRNSDALHKIEKRRSFLLEALRHANPIISPSHTLRDIYVDAGLEAEKIVLVRQGRDFPYLRPIDLQKVPSTCLRIGYIGQVAWHKGVHVLLDAVRLLPDARLSVRVYGDPSQFPRYVAELKRHFQIDKRLEMKGRFQKDELSRVLKEVDIVVVPSIWYENSPNVILEAFAHKTPVIASDVGGMAELVDHGVNGLLFRMGDPQDLARQIDRIMDDPGLLRRLQEGVPEVKSMEDEVREMVAVFSRIISLSEGESSIRDRAEELNAQVDVYQDDGSGGKVDPCRD